MCSGYSGKVRSTVGYAFTAMEPIYYQHFIASNELMLKLSTLGGLPELPELMVTVSSGEKYNFCGLVVKCYCDDVADVLGISLLCGLRNEKKGLLQLCILIRSIRSRDLR